MSPHPLSSIHVTHTPLTPNAQPDPHFPPVAEVEPTPGGAKNRSAKELRPVSDRAGHDQEPQRKNGVNWNVVGMGSGSDYAADADGTADLASEGGAWIDLDVKAMAQVWVSHPDNNLGLVLLQEAASGAVYYNFCSELGWSPCIAAQVPKLTIWYH